MKRFKELFESPGAPAQDNKPKKDDDQEVKGYKPRSKGEEDFANAHTVDKVDHPVAEPHQHEGGTSKGNADQHVGGKKHAGGETAPIKQGASDVKASGKEYKNFKQFMRGGEKAPVMQGSSKIKEEVELEEGVLDTVKKIVDSKQEQTVRFKNGKSIKVDPKTANALLTVHKALKPANAKKFAATLEKGERNFMSMVDFAMSNV